MDENRYVNVSEIFDVIINQRHPHAIVHGDRYDLVYGNIGNDVVSVVKCIPRDGFILYEVGGAITKNRPLVYKTFLALSEREAKERYEELMGWKATECRSIPPGEESTKILTTPLRMPL